VGSKKKGGVGGGGGGVTIRIYGNPNSASAFKGFAVEVIDNNSPKNCTSS